MFLSPEIIASTLHADPAGVAAVWPLVVSALEAQGIWSPATEIAAAATIQVEVGKRWRPIEEGRAKKEKSPKVWAQQERYWPSGYYGRGLIQLTLEPNYRAAGLALGIDLLGHPELALEPETSARIFAWFFKGNAIKAMADAGKWTKIRRTINGGNGVDRLDGGTTNSLNDFLAAVRALTARSIPNAPTPGL